MKWFFNKKVYNGVNKYNMEGEKPAKKIPLLEDKQENDVVYSLNTLYQQFQDEYVQNQDYGQVSVVSRSHIVCNGSKGTKIVTLPDLYLVDDPAVREIRAFATLLPGCAKFFIKHYPHSYDIFTIIWKDGTLDIPKRP